MVALHNILLGASGAAPVSAMAWQASAGVNNNYQVTVPASAQAGDLAIFCDNINTASSITAPTGWSTVSTASVASNVTVGLFYKILTSGDLNATISSQDTSTTDHGVMISIFRPTGTLTSATPGSVNQQATTGDPTLQTVSASGQSAPLGVFFAMMQRYSNASGLNVTTVPTNDGVDELAESTTVRIRLYYKFYNTGSSPANVTGDIGDSGAQGMISCYMLFA